MACCGGVNLYIERSEAQKKVALIGLWTRIERRRDVKLDHLESFAIRPRSLQCPDLMLVY